MSPNATPKFADRVAILSSHVARPAMTLPLEHQPLDGAPIQKIIIVDRIAHDYLGPFKSASLPGHLIHIVLSGEVEYEVGHRRQRLTPGTGVWHYENEPIKGRIVRSPWTFYSALFTGPMPPPSFEERVFPVTPQAIERFQSLLEDWNDESGPPLLRHLRTFSLLAQVLMEMLPSSAPAHQVDAPTHLWWQIEARLREDLGQPIDLLALQRIGRRSQRSILRACRLAVGTSPMRRVKELRLSYARGLVHYSPMPMTEIAMRVGYGRVQEFSRDYHRRFGICPRADRRAGPNYKQQPHE
jgi:AraC-like DNA-binding protein